MASLVGVEQDIKDLAKTRSLKLERYGKAYKTVSLQRILGYQAKILWVRILVSSSSQENISLRLRVVHNRECYEMIYRNISTIIVKC